MHDIHITKILEKVHEERGLDFSGYRMALLERRVTTRVRVVKRANFEEYFAYLKFHSEEMDNLLDVLTINVTEFFRDPHVFDAIEKRVIPDLIVRRSSFVARDSNPVSRITNDASHLELCLFVRRRAVFDPNAYCRASRI